MTTTPQQPGKLDTPDIRSKSVIFVSVILMVLWTLHSSYKVTSLLSVSREAKSMQIWTGNEANAASLITEYKSETIPRAVLLHLNETRISGQPRNSVAHISSKALSMPKLSDGQPSSSSSSSSPYAYVFLLAGCDLELPKYRPLLYSAYVCIHLLRQYGSTADIILFYGMLYDSPHDDLPQSELEVFRHFNVTLRKLLKSPSQSFYNIQLHKFRILGLTQYRRIIYLDTDIMPLENLDHYFTYSDENVHSPPLLQENVVLRARMSPSSGGFFMLTPHPGDLQSINDIIQSKERRINRGGKFDVRSGWGHTLPLWKGLQKFGTGWNFYAASGDQGLLFYWVMFVQSKVSVILPYGRIENWVSDDVDGEKMKMEVRNAIFSKPNSNANIPDPALYSHWPSGNYRPLSKLIHFMGTTKPWFKGCPYDLSEATKFKSAQYFWCATLQELNVKFSLRINIAGMHDSVKNFHPNITRNPSQTKGLLTTLLD